MSTPPTLALRLSHTPLIPPVQDTYIVFGTSETDRSGSEVRAPYWGTHAKSRAVATSAKQKVTMR